MWNYLVKYQFLLKIKDCYFEYIAKSATVNSFRLINKRKNFIPIIDTFVRTEHISWEFVRQELTLILSREENIKIARYLLCFGLVQKQLNV